MHSKSWTIAVTALVIGLHAPACKRESVEQHAHDDDHAPAASSAKPHAHGDEHAHGHEELEKRLIVPKEAVESAGIQVERVKKVALSSALSLPGEVSADPDRLARISSPAAGRVEKVSFREGDSVKKGAPLVVIRVPEIARVRATHLSALAKAKAARADAVRQRALFAQGLAPEQEALNAETEADAFDIEARSTAQQLGALGAGAAGAYSITISSPIDGAVVAREAVVGQPAAADQSLGTIADLREVWFLARVFEKDLGQLKVGAAADVHLNAYDGEHFQGTVEYIGQQIDPVARTVTARVRLENPKGLLRIGLFGTCQVSTGSGDQAGAKLVVDHGSVTEVGGKPVVFVKENDGAFELHEVTLGREALGKVEILAGLREGEEVVSQGVFTLKSMVLKDSFGEGHGH
jgi:cobalt-zinc-cadmium efflux system membrane fusion protein